MKSSGCGCARVRLEGGGSWIDNGGEELSLVALITFLSSYLGHGNRKIATVIASSNGGVLIVANKLLPLSHASEIVVTLLYYINITLIEITRWM